MMTLASLPWKAASICSEVGSELVRSNVYMDMTNPGVQNPHCEPCELAIDSCILITLNHSSQTQLLEICALFGRCYWTCHYFQAAWYNFVEWFKLGSTHKRYLCNSCSTALLPETVETRWVTFWWLTVFLFDDNNLRPGLEYGCVVWHHGLTVAHAQSQKRESLQKRALRIIHQIVYDMPYDSACEYVGVHVHTCAYSRHVFSFIAMLRYGYAGLWLEVGKKCRAGTQKRQYLWNA